MGRDRLGQLHLDGGRRPPDHRGHQPRGEGQRPDELAPPTAPQRWGAAVRLPLGPTT